MPERVATVSRVHAQLAGVLTVSVGRSKCLPRQSDILFCNKRQAERTYYTIDLQRYPLSVAQFGRFEAKNTSSKKWNDENTTLKRYTISLRSSETLRGEVPLFILLTTNVPRASLLSYLENPLPGAVTIEMIR